MKRRRRTKPTTPDHILYLIVKVQRPLASTDEHPPALIYDRTRKLDVFWNYERVASLFQPDADGIIPLKVYMKARYNKVTKTLDLIKRVSDREW